MRKLAQLAVVAAALVATPAFAEMKVAVLNYQMALLESDAAKKYAVDAEKKFGPQLTKLKSLESSAKGIQDRLIKGGDKMQQQERERLELEFKQKARDFQFQSKELNEAKAVADRDMLKQPAEAGRCCRGSDQERRLRPGSRARRGHRCQTSVRHHPPSHRAHEPSALI